MATLDAMARYREIRWLAAGGMAELILAEPTEGAGPRRPVVIKRVLKHLCREQEFLAMFSSEAHLAMQLHHPNIVEVLETGIDAGVPYLVMEYLEGTDLRSLLRAARARDERIEPAAVLHIGEAIARGLHHAHTLTSGEDVPLGVVHRDVSPHNIFLTRDGSVKVLDFGIAKSIEQLTVTRTGVFKGKLGYAAPEQLSGLEIDARADLYALGVVMWEMLVGARLWKRDSDAEVTRAIIEEMPPSPSSRVPGIPGSVDAIVMALLSPIPASRPSTGAEVAHALRSIGATLGKSSSTETVKRLVERHVSPRSETLPGASALLAPANSASDEASIGSNDPTQETVLPDAPRASASVTLTAAPSAVQIAPLAPDGSTRVQTLRRATIGGLALVIVAALAGAAIARQQRGASVSSATQLPTSNARVASPPPVSVAPAIEPPRVAQSLGTADQTAPMPPVLVAPPVAEPHAAEAPPRSLPRAHPSSPARTRPLRVLRRGPNQE
jgi:serine/threonine protein kinase